MLFVGRSSTRVWKAQESEETVSTFLCGEKYKLYGVYFPCQDIIVCSSMVCLQVWLCQHNLMFWLFGSRHFYKNALTGPIPEEYRNLTNLVELYVQLKPSPWYISFFTSNCWHFLLPAAALITCIGKVCNVCQPPPTSNQIYISQVFHIWKSVTTVDLVGSRRYSFTAPLPHHCSFINLGHMWSMVLDDPVSRVGKF